MIVSPSLLGRTSSDPPNNLEAFESIYGLLDFQVGRRTVKPEGVGGSMYVVVRPSRTEWVGPGGGGGWETIQIDFVSNGISPP